MELRAHDNSLAEKTASPAAGNLPGMKETLVGGTGLVLGKWYPNEGLDDSGNGGGVRGADEVPPALTGLVKGKEKIEEGGLNETRGEKGGKKRGSEGKQEGARQPVVKGYSIELGEDFQSLREAHIQVGVRRDRVRALKRKLSLRWRKR